MRYVMVLCEQCSTVQKAGRSCPCCSCPVPFPGEDLEAVCKLVGQEPLRVQRRTWTMDQCPPGGIRKECVEEWS